MKCCFVGDRLIGWQTDHDGFGVQRVELPRRPGEDGRSTACTGLDPVQIFVTLQHGTERPDEVVPGQNPDPLIGDERACPVDRVDDEGTLGCERK